MAVESFVAMGPAELTVGAETLLPTEFPADSNQVESAPSLAQELFLGQRVIVADFGSVAEAPVLIAPEPVAITENPLRKLLTRPGVKVAATAMAAVILACSWGGGLLIGLPVGLFLGSVAGVIKKDVGVGIGAGIVTGIAGFIAGSLMVPAELGASIETVVPVIPLAALMFIPLFCASYVVDRWTHKKDGKKQ